MLARVLAFVFLVAAIFGCGASLRFADQSAAYFEYCHAAERDPRLGVKEKIACWEAFVEYWAMESDIQRAGHARERLVALHESGDPASYEELPLGKGVDGAKRPEQDARTERREQDARTELREQDARTELREQDARTELREQDARTELREQDARTELREQDARLRSPSSSCETHCEPRYLRCEAGCSGEEKPACRAACKAEHRFCQKACT